MLSLSTNPDLQSLWVPPEAFRIADQQVKLQWCVQVVQVGVLSNGWQLCCCNTKQSMPWSYVCHVCYIMLDGYVHVILSMLGSTALIATRHESYFAPVSVLPANQLPQHTLMHERPDHGHDFRSALLLIALGYTC